MFEDYSAKKPEEYRKCRRCGKPTNCNKIINNNTLCSLRTCNCKACLLFLCKTFFWFPGYYEIIVKDCFNKHYKSKQFKKEIYELRIRIIKDNVAKAI